MRAGCQQPETTHSVSVAGRHVCGKSVDEFLNQVVRRHDPLFFQVFRQKVAFTIRDLRESVLGNRWSSNVARHTGRKLRIEQSLWRGKLVPPKTQGSVRTIYFGNALASALTEHFQQVVHRGPDDFVFSKKDGSPLQPDVLRKDLLYPILDWIGIPRGAGTSGFHTFRHSAASILNAQTGNLKLAQKLPGHSNIDMTAEVYAHISAEAEREAALAIERAIYGDLFPIVPNPGERNNSAAIN